MEDYWLILILIGFFSIFILAICIFIDYTNRKTKMKDDEYKEYKEKRKNERKQNQARIEELYRQKKTIKKVIVIGSSFDSRKKVTSSAARGIVGDALLGPGGALVGIASGKNKVTNYTTFLIEYADGHKESKTVKNDSSEYKKLINYIEM